MGVLHALAWWFGSSIVVGVIVGKALWWRDAGRAGRPRHLNLVQARHAGVMIEAARDP